MKNRELIEKLQKLNPELDVKIIDINDEMRTIHENDIDIHAFYATASAKIKKIPFQNIIKIRLIASKQVMSSKYKVSRWHHLDVAEISP